MLNGDLGGNPKTLVTEMSDETISQNELHSSTVHTTTRYRLKVRLPKKAPVTSSNLSYNLGSPEFDEIEPLAYHSDYVDQVLPKSIEEALSSPEWYRAMKRNTTLYRRMKFRTSLKCQKEKTS